MKRAAALLSVTVAAACGGGHGEAGGVDAGAIDAAADLVQVTPAWDEELGPVRPHAFGHNAVWSRGGLGLWDEEAGALRADVVELVRDLAPGALRFPGGTRAMRYHFDEAIGPVAERTPQCDTFTGELDDTTYGLDEFLALAEELGADVTLVSPWVDGSPEEAAALVAYVNAELDATTTIGVDVHGTDWRTAGDWAALRAEHGHPAPYGVRYLEIGNEQYLDLSVGPSSSCGRPSQFRQSERWTVDGPIPTTAADHAAQVALTGALVHAVDPDIQVGASALASFAADAEDAATLVADVDAAAGSDDAWNPRLVADAADDFDFFVLHPYEFAATDGRLALAERLRAAVHDLRELAPDKGIAVTEFGFLFDGGTQLNALVSADMVRVGVEEGLLLVLRHILIEDDPGGPFANSAAILGSEHALTPGYHALRRLAEAFLPVAVPVTSSDARLPALALRDADGGQVTIVLVDLDPDAVVRRVRIALPDGEWDGQVTLQHADTLDAQVVSQDSEQVDGAVSALDVTPPPHALAVVTLARR